MLRIDPAARPLWRTPDCVQLGVDPVLALIDPVPPGADRVLGALVDGVDRVALELTAERARLSPDALARLLDAVAPALLPEPRPSPPELRVTVDGPEDLTALLAGLLDLAPLPAPTPVTADLVLVAAHHLVPPAATVRHLHDEVPHLAVVFGDQSVVVGPLVRPGTTPCLRCAEEHRLDSPGRRAVGTQLLRRARSRTAHTLVTRLRAGALVAGVLADARAGRTTGLEGAELRLAPDGTVSRRPRPWHDRCSCRWDAAPPG